MRRALSERNLVVVLFILAFVVSVFAEQDAKRIEKTYTNTILTSTGPLSPSLPNTISATRGYSQEVGAVSLLFFTNSKANKKAVK
jgi:hypothetical protein